MKNASGGVTAPKGFRASGVAVGVKPGSTKKDCALIVSDAPASVAGMFTTNIMKSAPVLWDMDVCRRGHAQAVFVNSGNANACTGEQGEADVQTIASQVGAGLNIPAQAVCVCSTGVIGVPLPMDTIKKGVSGCLAALTPTGSSDAAAAIMTTDTVPKEMAVQTELSTGLVTFGSIAKGSGMIAPNMATMLCFITTDAAIDPEPLSVLLREAVQGSFNRICVDNDMSTSDTVLCLANGQGGTPKLEPGSADFKTFGEALKHICIETAKKLVKDGEGATKFVEIEVSGAASDPDAHQIARSIAMSQLCKTAFFGQDPNWGRIACAAGYAGISFNPDQLNIWLDDLQLLQGGMPCKYEEAEAARRMQEREFRIRVSLGNGPGKAVFWTSDLSHDYVTINADYRT